MSSAITRLLKSHVAWPAVEHVLATLQKAGFEAVLAGGCVRDALLGKAAHDFDIATSANPDQVQALFPNTVAVGKEFGVIIVVVEKNSIEVATFRRDGPYLDGRRPASVTYSDMREDALRRDFTINAMFFDPLGGKIYDFVQGQSDLKAGTIRTVGAPEVRFSEDRLRPLRAVRFSAQLGFVIEENTLKQIAHFAPELSKVSRERVTEELRKLLKSARAETGVMGLADTGLLEQIFPGLQQRLGQPGGPEWKRLGQAMAKLGPGQPFGVSLAVVFYFARAGRDQVVLWLRNLKCASQEIDEAAAVLRALQLVDSPQRPRLGHRLLLLDKSYGPQLLLLWQALSVQTGGETLWLAETVNAFRLQMTADGHLPRCLVNGDDLKAVGYSANAKLGVILEEIYNLQLEGQLTSRAEALAFAVKKRAEDI